MKPLNTAIEDPIAAASGTDVSSVAQVKNETLRGTKRNDVLVSGNGDDELFGGNGSDFLAGRAGSDKHYGGNHDDILFHEHRDGDKDYYDGGNGKDLLILSFTVEQWDRLNGDEGALRNELRDFGAWIASDAYNPKRKYELDTIDVTVRGVEYLAVAVGDEFISLDDEPVTAVNDEFTVSENVTAAPLAVTQNDTAEDGIADIEIVAGPERGAVSVQDGAVVFDANGDFEDLAVGEAAQVTFTYALADTDGDTDEATVTVTVTGENDAPVAADVQAAVTENGSDFAPVLLEDGPRTVVNAGGFYVLDAATGAMTYVPRGAAGLHPDDVAPDDGAVVYINPNTNNWFVQAVGYTDGEATVIDPASFVLEGYSGETMTTNGSLFLMGSGADMTLSIDLPAFQTSDGLAQAGVRFEGLVYESDAAKTVEVASVAVAVEPVGTEAPIVIAPDAFDVDGDDLSFAIDAEGTLGSVSVNDDGTFTYDQGQAFAALAEGEIAVDTFTYVATDEHGATSEEATVSVTVTGTNDGPVAQNVAAEVYAEASQISGFEAEVGARDVPNAGMFFVLDYDTGDVATIVRGGSRLTVDDVAPMNGIALHLNPNTASMNVDAAYYENGVKTLVDPTALLPEGFDGEHYVYGERLVLLEGLENGTVSVVVDELATPDGFARAELTLSDVHYEGPHVSETATVGTTKTAMTQAPVDTSVVVMTDFYDPDDTVFTFSLDTSGTLGMVTNNGDGTFLYETAGGFDALDAGESAVDTFSYTVTDAVGASDTQTVEVTVTGTVTDDLILV